MILAALVAVCSGASVNVAAGQATASIDAALLSAYHWRGLTQTNRPVVQPSAMLDVAMAGGALQAGTWANFEPARYDGAGDLRSGGELMGPAVTATAFWAEYEHRLGAAAMGVGMIAYRYPRSTGFAEQYNTAEAFVRIGLDAPLAPSVMIHHDVGSVAGTYAEASLQHGFALAPWFPLGVGLLAGVNAGQAEESEEHDVAYFHGNGLTHLELSAAVPLVIGSLAVVPVAHFTINRDEFTRFTAPGEQRGTKLWAGVHIAWSRPLGRSR